MVKYCFFHFLQFVNTQCMKDVYNEHRLAVSRRMSNPREHHRYVTELAQALSQSDMYMYL